MTPKTLPLLRGLRLAGYGAILLDPPWHFRGHTADVSNRDPQRHYPIMSMTEITDLPIKNYAAKSGCHLFLWTTGPFLPHAIEVMKAWGFKYSGVAFTWVKLKKSHDPNQLRILPSADGDFHVGLGFTTRKNAEFCLLGRYGNAKRRARDVREIIIAPRREHSRKPDETRERIERYCDGPYLELFARSSRKGWTTRGDESVKFDAA